VRRAAPILLATCLVACASRPQAPPEDPALASRIHAGNTAYDLERPEEAVAQYRAALALARTRDDATAIADAGFNLAAAELRAGHPSAAIAVAQEVQDELARRRRSDHGLDLIIATAMFRMGDLAEADRIAAGLTVGGDRRLADSAWFLRGLIADTRGNRILLQTAVSSLSPTSDPADAAELRARLDRNAQLALKAADLRRDALDYRGMARDLALAGHLTPDANAAADLYLRAGRSAAGQSDTPMAKAWLGKARDVAHDPALRGVATAELRSLDAR
jgi:tetratricopeptide (TPR) repeat protein